MMTIATTITMTTSFHPRPAIDLPSLCVHTNRRLDPNISGFRAPYAALNIDALATRSCGVSRSIPGAEMRVQGRSSGEWLCSPRLGIAVRRHMRRPLLFALSDGAGARRLVSPAPVASSGSAPAPRPRRSRTRSADSNTGCWTRARAFSCGRTADREDGPFPPPRRGFPL
jgi:hypothetical protein